MEDNIRHDLKNWLPVTKKELEIRGWDEVDVILFSGDAYVDHPAFGAAVIGRVMEKEGLRVAIVPQPNWRDDLRDFKKLGKPRMFFAISAGAMDSMVNRYTANKRLRSDDAYTPDGRPDMRPDRTTIVYSRILKELYPNVPVIVGGIEASLRRFTHYDYWDDELKPSILSDSKADLLIYGMGEKAITDIAAHFKNGGDIQSLKHIPQTAYLTSIQDLEEKENDLKLFSHEECLADKLKQAENFRHIEEESNSWNARRLMQNIGKQSVVVNPPYPLWTTEELDRVYELPYTRLPHPKYKGKTIPAFEMIKFSVNLHRGCFGGCSFCTISAHQGKFVISRSKESVLREVKKVIEMPGFKGYLSDLGGPSANMYLMKGKNENACRLCRKPSCISPKICANLNYDHRPLVEIYDAVNALPGIKKAFIGSGVRYDLLIDSSPEYKAANELYTRRLIENHVSGRLKVAPEHTSNRVLSYMRKPSFHLFEKFKKKFDEINRKVGLKQQIIPYFISSHPGCAEEDMAELAVKTKTLDFKLEQVQDFTPTPMTLSTEMLYTGYHPYTLKPVYTAHTKEEKLAQRQFFFWYLPENRKEITRSLRKIARIDLEKKLYAGNSSYQVPPSKTERKDRKTGRKYR